MTSGVKTYANMVPSQDEDFTPVVYKRNRRNAQPATNAPQDNNAATKRNETGKKARKGGFVTGSRQNATIKSGPCRLDLFVFRVSREVDEDDLTEDIKAQGAQIVEIKRMSADSRASSSYRVILECNDPRKVMTSDFWPSGVCVRRFYPPRQ